MLLLFIYLGVYGCYNYDMRNVGLDVWTMVPNDYLTNLYVRIVFINIYVKSNNNNVYIIFVVIFCLWFIRV